MAYMEIELLQSLVFKLIELKKKKLEELGGQYCVEKNVIPEAETFQIIDRFWAFSQQRYEEHRQLLQVIRGWEKYENCVDVYDLQIVIETKSKGQENQESLETKVCEEYIEENISNPFFKREADKIRLKLNQRMIPYGVLRYFAMELSREEKQNIYPDQSVNQQKYFKAEKQKRSYLSVIKSFLSSVPAMIGCFKKVEPKEEEKDLDDETFLLKQEEIKKGVRSQKLKLW